MTVELPDVPAVSESENNSVNLNRTVEEKIIFQLETASHFLDVSDSSCKLSVHSAVSINNEIISFREAKILNALILQILQYLQNENDCASVANTTQHW